MNIIDIRPSEAYEKAHIEGVTNIPFAQLRERCQELDENMFTVLVCGSGYRASLAASLLQRRGFSNVANIIGGMTGYNAWIARQRKERPDRGSLTSERISPVEYDS